MYTREQVLDMVVKATEFAVARAEDMQDVYEMVVGGVEAQLEGRPVEDWDEEEEDDES